MTDEARFSLFDIDSEPELTNLHDVCDYWRKIKGEKDRVAPSWQEIDLTQLPYEIIPRVCVLDVLPKGPDFLYRFWGSAITDMHRYDLTGKSVHNLTPAHYARCIWRQYNTVLEAHAPLGFVTEVPLEDGRVTYYAAIRLPLSSNGKTIDKILSAEDYGKERRQLERLFEKVWLDQNS